MNSTFKTILFTSLCFLFGACGTMNQNQSTLPTPATVNAGLTLPRADSVEANNLYANALDCYEQQHRATAETRVADRCNALRSYAIRGDDTTQLAEVVSCFNRNDHTSRNCVRYVDTTQPPTPPQQPAQTQVAQGQPEQRSGQQPVAQPQQPADQRMAAMQPWALQMAQRNGLQLCANDQVMPGGPVNDRMIFTDLPFPGATSFVPDLQAQRINGTGLITIELAPTPYAYRFYINDGNGEQMYVFEGVVDSYGQYRIRRGGTVVHTRRGDCLAPLLMPDGGSHYLTFRSPPGITRYIAITAYAAPEGSVATPINTCRWPFTAGTYGAMQGPRLTIRPEFFEPRRALDGVTVLPPSCGTM